MQTYEFLCFNFCEIHGFFCLFRHHILMKVSKRLLETVVHLILNQIILVLKVCHTKYRWNSWCNARIHEISKKINAKKSSRDSKIIHGT